MGACHALGMMYQTIPEMRDDDKARELNQRACDGGHSGACNALGR
jgi:TPR repeat protein